MLNDDTLVFLLVVTWPSLVPSRSLPGGGHHDAPDLTRISGDAADVNEHGNHLKT